MEQEIVVTYDRDSDLWTRQGWFATLGDYDLGCTVGNGRTPLDAIVDLLDQLEG